jgi:hypothetical protein
MREDDKIFNSVFSQIVNKYKPLYAIAFYDMYELKSLEVVGDNLEELKERYKKDYAWKKNEIGVTEYHYEIIKINIEALENE